MYIPGQRVIPDMSHQRLGSYFQWQKWKHQHNPEITCINTTLFNEANFSDIGKNLAWGSCNTQQDINLLVKVTLKPYRFVMIGYIDDPNLINAVTSSWVCTHSTKRVMMFNLIQITSFPTQSMCSKLVKCHAIILMFLEGILWTIKVAGLFSNIFILYMLTAVYPHIRFIAVCML